MPLPLTQIIYCWGIWSINPQSTHYVIIWFQAYIFLNNIIDVGHSFYLNENGNKKERGISLPLLFWFCYVYYETKIVISNDNLCQQTRERM